jgi:hypothetical protein
MGRWGAGCACVADQASVPLDGALTPTPHRRNVAQRTGDEYGIECCLLSCRAEGWHCCRGFSVLYKLSIS